MYLIFYTEDFINCWNPATYASVFRIWAFSVWRRKTWRNRLLYGSRRRLTLSMVSRTQLAGSLCRGAGFCFSCLCFCGELYFFPKPLYFLIETSLETLSDSLSGNFIWQPLSPRVVLPFPPSLLTHSYRFTHTRYRGAVATRWADSASCSDGKPTCKK